MTCTMNEAKTMAQPQPPSGAGGGGGSSGLLGAAGFLSAGLRAAALPFFSSG